MPKAIRTLADLTPDAHNANKHTQRGGGMVAESMQKYGAGRSILVDKNGKIIAGGQTTETAAEIGIEDIILVPSDGTKLVVVQRTDLDLDSSKDMRARALSIADNRSSEVNLSWDTEELTRLATELDLTQFWTADEMREMMGTVVEDDTLPIFKEYDESVENDLPTDLCESCGRLCLKPGVKILKFERD